MREPVEEHPRASVRFGGKTYRVGTGNTPVSLVEAGLVPRGLPSHFAHVRPAHSPDPAYQRWYVSTTGLRVCLTADLELDGLLWLHVSVSHRGGRLPTWSEMALVKDLFCGRERTAYQVHPPSSQHVNIHRSCLHLWCCIDGPVTPDFTRGGELI